MLQLKMIMQDKLEKERADAKNSVEEYVYDMRDKLYSTYEDFVKEGVRFVIKILWYDHSLGWLFL